MKTEMKSLPGAFKSWLAKNEIKVDDSGPHFWLSLNPPRPFEADETGLSLQRTADGRARAVLVAARAHHLLLESFDENVVVLNGSGHLMLSSSQRALSESTEESLHIGSLEEILGPEGSYLDTDSECEYDEEYATFVKSVPVEREHQTLAVSNYTTEDLLKSFTIFTISLADVEMTAEKSTEPIVRLWDIYRGMNHPSTSQLLIVLQNSLPQSMKLPSNVSRAVKNVNCPRCLKDSRHNRVPLRPSVSAAIAQPRGR